MVLRKILTGMGVLMVCAAGFAANAPGMAVVDLQSVLEKSGKLEAVTASLKKQFEADSKTMEAEQTALFKDLEAFRKNQSTMKKEDAEAKQKALMARQSTLVKKQQQFSEKVQKAREGEMTKLYGDLQKVVEAVAKKKNVKDAVFLKQAVVVANIADLTPEVAKAFSAK